MPESLSPLLQALDRLDRLPAAPRCADPDWSRHTQARHLQALYAEHHGHHVPAAWAEQMWPLLQAEAPTPVPVPVSSPSEGGWARGRDQRNMLLMGVGCALLTAVVLAWGPFRHSTVAPQEDRAPVTTSDLVPFTAEIQGAPAAGQDALVN